MSAIEALFIYDEHNSLLFNHVYTGKPPAASIVLPLYLQHESPRPSVIYLTSTNPPTVLFSIIQDHLLFLSPASSDVEPLLVLEFLHRVADAWEEFLGSPLIATKISANYDIVAQIVAEMADSGVVCQGEASALRDVVETGPGVLKNLLGGVGLPGSSPNLQGIASGGLSRPSLSPAQTSQGSAIPWRRSNVVHSHNEMYVDIVETLQVTLAPSGRPLSAFANGSIAFNSKLSGVPDLVLTLSTGGKGAGMGTRGDQLRNVMERVVFHPCVRLAKWKAEGILSFVPPDGRFALCGYETDLLGPDTNFSTNKSASNSLDLPATVEITTGLGPSGADFEVRAKQNSASFSPAAASLQSNLGSGRPGAAFRNAAPTGQSSAPALEDLTIHVPLPPSVRNLSDMRPSKGESQWNPVDGTVEWRISAKDFGPGGAVLRCTVLGPVNDDNEDSSTGVVNGMTATTYDYDEEPSGYQVQGQHGSKSNGYDTPQKNDRNRELMPSSATLSFTVKGWLASGLKVESLVLDTKKSRGILPGTKPYKGVKYVTVSRRGVEMRC
ncbi:Putative clathrin adaptor, mu subunit, Longin-like domain superfamily [Septoria linicola]|uniref:Clathrin adaptor, mu subunit, Longin-like domain superfamily n=1 Tax=Septoria linicola TaxID=215465 RepID=A0A9Q9AH40_9PEZI|nr:putative clathrin adaptor, mu subunit, Longin-like domain superfamily [Septoria linicola]USW49294.1 Putative clathrin adaptor, mu subunit, Longin-like domain superfamily [Septoria linicola]